MGAVPAGEREAEARRDPLIGLLLTQRNLVGVFSSRRLGGCQRCSIRLRLPLHVARSAAEHHPHLRRDARWLVATRAHDARGPPLTLKDAP